jgi:putative transposase
VLEISRSNLIQKIKEKPKRSKQYKKEDKDLLETIREIIDARPAYGYRRVTALLNAKLQQSGKQPFNHKKIFRIMKQNNLLLQKKLQKPKRPHEGKVETLLSNTRWCSDCFSIQCWNGDKVHVAFSLDTCDREVMRYVASTIGIDGQMIRDLMLETVEYRFGQPKVPYALQWLSDNGSCFTAHETVNFGRSLGLDIRTTPPYSPESNGMAEAFVKTFKRDYMWFGDLKDALAVMSQLPKWVEDYNEKAPHKALNMLPPREYLKREMLKRCV